jgi:hypothetical protein
MKATRTLASAFALAAIAAGVTVLPSQPAVAAPECSSQPVRNNDKGWGITWHTAQLRKAPYGHCGVNANLADGTKVYFHCWAINSYGNRWAWARKAGTETYGWVWEGHIREHNIEEQPGVLYKFCQNEPSPADPDGWE